MKGLFPLGLSILLTTLAQLLLRAALVRLPAMSSWLGQPTALLDTAGLLLVLGILCYGLSLLAWLAALARLPLGRAYAALGLSYVFVHLGAAWLPGAAESFTPWKTLGIVLVVAGVALVGGPRPTAAPTLRNTL
ncbi:4-amino-4-deoxy-L-arabinose-phosphoundecaprenol flippase subunit ArnF [Pseudomonas oryzihabitans]|uniref:4-amino-4-deoxy-L-arabinose-phosphoundecaprenol flippase subunit ArnF n=1 Tax=Pseudomonas oryzihabitans TaxID=47885 RepID=UPI0011242C5E|nr:4-amino-4-deoxy-L-arabinose-phosphoundecaprenol flippase subunit ArnF [Pseudomonas psychrotolerans]QDD90677.1 hypothetical protein CCZ28_17310 [Pseudomonas psychrotolerans]